MGCEDRCQARPGDRAEVAAGRGRAMTAGPWQPPTPTARPGSWDAASLKLIHVLPHPGLVNSVAFSPDGRWLLTGCADKLARLWDATTGTARGPAAYHAASLVRVVFAPDGSRFLTPARTESSSSTGRGCRAPHRADSSRLWASGRWPSHPTDGWPWWVPSRSTGTQGEVELRDMRTSTRVGRLRRLE